MASSDRTYAELVCASAFSFLEGASLANELVAQAAELGLTALGIADRNTVAGIVRAHDAAKTANLRLLPGARLTFADTTPDIVCYPRDRAAWGRLTRLLTDGKRRAKKGDCDLRYADLQTYAEGQELIVIPPATPDAAFTNTLATLAADFRRQTWLALTPHHRADDRTRLHALAEQARTHRIRPIATNDVLYHTADRRILQDAMTCIRHGKRIDEAGWLLNPNAERHLKPAAEMSRLLRPWPDAITATIELTARCTFSLDELRYEYPDEPIPPGLTPDQHLANLAWKGAAQRYPDGIPARITKSLQHELALIAQLDYAPYFLTVHDIVRYARSREILCQGRGSAANSTVCYCIGITAVDPAQIDLLFERFISAERREPPDIDVDFEHERREEVIQYIYNRYGRHRAGIAATVIHYRPRSAIREIGKVMGLPEDATAALSAQSWNPSGQIWDDPDIRDAGLDPTSPHLRRTIDLARTLLGFPRHLSQHVGGFILTKGRLDETVPIGNAAMDDRTFIEWDKDDIDTLGIMKVDVLALGMLTCIRKAFSLIGIKDLADIPREDPTTYAMLCRGDSLGVFQVESRAQMNMLPRLQPRCFYDLVIEVAIVRPGPIQGDMVHPYLRRRTGKEDVTFPSPAPEHGPPDELRRVLGRTLGVPLFQEQAMKIAIDAAKFTPGEANQLRRSMATFRHMGTIHSFREKMVHGMTARGYAEDFAQACFRQIEGFGTYGFPESHAASFAWLVYVSAWLKCHHPAAFACALLNSQPMGFYAPAQIVRDARTHGVPTRAADIATSTWNNTLEPDGALRLGLRQITGFHEDWAEVITQSRPANFPALARLTLPRAALVLLAEADALRGIGLDRRAALWAVRGLDDAPRASLAQLPLFTETREPEPAPLPPMPIPEHVMEDYQSTGLSLKAHPLRFLRADFARESIASCAELSQTPHGRKLKVAGIVLVRQRPGTAGGVVFATIEDETGTANIVIWASMIQTYRREILGSSLILVQGEVQRSEEGVIHLIAEHLEDRSAALHRLTETPAPPRARSPKHPRNERPLQKSRDFH